MLDLDGERIVDSTRIIAALEERGREPALYPAERTNGGGPSSSRTSDEHAGHDMRRVGFWEARRNLDYALAFMTTDQPRARVVVALARGSGSPLGWRYMSARYKFTEGAVERSRVTLDAALDRIEMERGGRDCQVGEDFTVADLTAASLLYPMVWPPEFQYELPEPPPWEFLESLRDHPALKWISRTWRRHRGTSAAT